MMNVRKISGHYQLQLLMIWCSKQVLTVGFPGVKVNASLTSRVPS